MFLRKPRSLALILIGILIVMIGLTGCGTGTVKTQSNASVTPANEGTSANPSGNSSASNDASSHSVKVTLYFPTPDAGGLVAIDRNVNVSNEEILQAMFKELNNPPSGLDNPIPKGTELLSATVKDGVATLNLSKQFKDNFGGGATGEQMILYSIVDTLTTLPNVKSVEFLLNGEKTVAILGELDTSTPLKRNESLIQKQ